MVESVKLIYFNLRVWFPLSSFLSTTLFVDAKEMTDIFPKVSFLWCVRNRTTLTNVILGVHTLAFTQTVLCMTGDFFESFFRKFTALQNVKSKFLQASPMRGGPGTFSARHFTGTFFVRHFAERSLHALFCWSFSPALFGRDFSRAVFCTGISMNASE